MERKEDTYLKGITAITGKPNSSMWGDNFALCRGDGGHCEETAVNMASSRSHQHQTFQDIHARADLARLCLPTSNKVSMLSHVQLFTALWTVAHQAPLGMGFSRQECWSGLPLATLGDLPNPGIEPTSPVLVGRFLPLALPGKGGPEFYPSSWGQK